MTVVVVPQEEIGQQRIRPRPPDEDQVVPVELAGRSHHRPEDRLQQDQCEGDGEHVASRRSRRLRSACRGSVEFGRHSQLLRLKVTNNPTVIATIAASTT